MERERLDPAGKASIARYVDWVRSVALPCWHMTGFDHRAGRFHERLSWQGRPLALPHRSMVQARQVYVFARAASLGWYPRGADAARAGMRLIRGVSRLDEDSRLLIPFTFDADTARPLTAVHDTYTYSFVLLALAAMYEVDRDAELLEVADRLLLTIDHLLTDPVNGGVFDGHPLQLSGWPKRQNSHMHLVEAYLALERVAPGIATGRRALRMIDLLATRMLDHASGMLPEHFSAEWRPAQAKPIWEPGHHYEWIWLLRAAERSLGIGSADLAGRLRASAERFGEAATGLLVDEIDLAGEIVKNSHRLWPHTEALKACVTFHRAGEVYAGQRAAHWASILLDRFVGRPFAGGWIDQLDPDLAPAVAHVPASSLYHLMLAATEADLAFGDVAPGDGGAWAVDAPSQDL